MNKTPSTKPAVMFDTAPDESFVIGTRAELADFANTIINLIGKVHSEEELLGINVESINERLTFLFGDVCLTGIAITRTIEDKRKLINKLRKNDGLPDVDPNAPD